MNTFEKHFRDFPAFIERILSWNPDFLVPVAKKGCKLLKTVDIPQLRRNPDLIKYRSFFELSDVSVKNKKIAIVDDATQYATSLQEYRRFFENRGAIVRTFSFVGHEDLVQGTRWKEDLLAEISKPLPQPVYQEYILQQSYHLLDSGNHFDLDHLIFELKLPSKKLDWFLSLIKTKGELLFTEDYFLKTRTKRFSLNQPSFFQSIPFLQSDAISLGAIRKIKFTYEQERETLCFSPLVFPTWDYRRADVGASLFRNVPFSLPYKLPDFLDTRNKSALLRVYYNIYFTGVVSFAKAFIQEVLPDGQFTGDVKIKRNDIDAVIGADAAKDFVASITEFISSSNNVNFNGYKTTRKKTRQGYYNNFADVLDDLKRSYERQISKRKSRVGIHSYLPYDTLFRRFGDHTRLSEDLDYYCDFGVIVPETLFRGGKILRGCRTGEPDPDYNWKRTQVLIPMAIDQFRAELRIKENEIEPTVLNKLLANFVFDYPSEVYHELHCLIGEPYTFGTLVGAYHRHRAPNKPNLYKADRISPYYEWDDKKNKFRVKERGRMVKEINTLFDDRQEVPYSEIVTYFKFLSRVYHMFRGVKERPVDILNMLSICRDENCLYCHILYNIRTSLEDFGAYLDTTSRDAIKNLIKAKTNAKSASDKVHFAKQIDQTVQAISTRLAREVEFVKAVEKLKRNTTPFSNAFKVRLQQLEEVIALELILTNLCFLVQKKDSSFVVELRTLNAHHVLNANGIILPENLASFAQNSAQQKQVINDLYSKVTSLIDALPRAEPMLAARLRNETRQKAKNIATSYVYKAKLSKAALLYVDFTGLRTIPEPKENLLSRYYQLIEQNCQRRGGVKLYGGQGGDDMFTILFSEMPPALQCAKDIKTDFAEDLFLHSSKCDIKFGLSYAILDGEQKEQKIIQCWGDAKDCCEFKSQNFRNRGNLLISQETLNALQALSKPDLFEKFEPVLNERLKSGSQIFRFTEVFPEASSEISNAANDGNSTCVRRA